MTINCQIINTHQIPPATRSDTKTVIDYFNNHAPVAVVIHDTEGMGHQSAAISIMRALKQRGYTGRFDLLCNALNEKTQQKLRALLGECNINKEYSNSDFKIFIPSSLEKKKYSVVINPADDDFPASYAAHARLYELSKTYTDAEEYLYLQFQPTTWAGNAGYRNIGFATPDTRALLNTYADTRIPYQGSLLCLRNKAVTQQLQPHTKLEKLICDIVNDNKYLHQMVYGLYPDRHDNDENLIIVLNNILGNAFMQNQEFDKNVVIFMPYIAADAIARVINKYQANNQQLLEFFSFLDINSQQDIHKSLAYKNITVVYDTQPLETSFFHSYTCGNFANKLPPIVEGCNATQDLEEAGVPFLRGLSRTPLTKLKFDNITKSLHTKACKAVSITPQMYDITHAEGLCEDLQNYTTQALNGDLKKYHKARRDAYRAQPTQIDMLIQVIAQHLRNTAPNQEEAATADSLAEQVGQLRLTTPHHKDTTRRLTLPPR